MLRSMPACVGAFHMHTFMTIPLYRFRIYGPMVRPVTAGAGRTDRTPETVVLCYPPLPRHISYLAPHMKSR